VSSNGFVGTEHEATGVARRYGAVAQDGVSHRLYMQSELLLYEGRARCIRVWNTQKA
jgi:hypothetical protein